MSSIDHRDMLRSLHRIEDKLDRIVKAVERPPIIVAQGPMSDIDMDELRETLDRHFHRREAGQ